MRDVVRRYREWVFGIAVGLPAWLIGFFLLHLGYAGRRVFTICVAIVVFAGSSAVRKMRQR